MARGAASSHPPTLTLPRNGGGGKEGTRPQPPSPLSAKEQRGKPDRSNLRKGKRETGRSRFFSLPLHGGGRGWGWSLYLG